MSETISKTSEIGWCFDNTYARLPKMMLSRLLPIPVKSPKLFILNKSLSEELGLNFSAINSNDLALMFAGNFLPQGSESIAQAYAGHQFGHFTMLGDGRAIMIGEHIAKNNKRFDIQFKGSGLTPYSRNADGRAALSPMLREYIISEAMHGLKIPTTRSLAVVTTGEDVIRETVLPGAILTRVASSHIRVGTFQYAAMSGDLKVLKTLVEYAVDRHYPNLREEKNLALALLKIVIEKQSELVTNWMRVGFIHGVMNTDNMTISGETLDYGPCAFMDTYDPKTVFSSIDHHGRYAYFNQPSITKWNLFRFAETLIPLIDSNNDKAISIANEVVNNFSKVYKKHWIEMMRKKIGLFGEYSQDENLINDLLDLMNKKRADYTNTFCFLMKKDIKEKKLFHDSQFIEWYKRWRVRMSQNNKTDEESINLMKSNNPLIIPRNHKVEESLKEASKNYNLKPLHKLLKILADPYNNNVENEDYKFPPTSNKERYRTFCGT